MEKVKFTLTTMARTMLMAFAFLSFSYGLHAQSYPTVGATSVNCDSASVTSVRFVYADSCSVPDKISMEFLAGGTGTAGMAGDPSAIVDHQWVFGYATSGGVSVATRAYTYAELAASRTGNSLKVDLNRTDFAYRKGSTTAGVTPWADSTLTFFVFQKCDGDANFTVPADSAAASVGAGFPTRVTGSVGNATGSKVENTRNVFAIKNSLGGFDTLNTCVLTSSKVITLDPLMGEVDTIWGGNYNDAVALKDSMTICISNTTLNIPNAENFELQLFSKNGGAAVNDNGTITNSGDVIRVDSLGLKNGQLCWGISITFDGSGTNGLASAVTTNKKDAGAEALIVKAAMKDCAKPRFGTEAKLGISDVKSDDFKATWYVNGGTTGHKFRVVMYQGENLVTSLSTLGDSKPDTATNWIDNRIIEASNTLLTSHRVAGDDSTFQFSPKAFGIDLDPCNSYQIWVAQICDGMTGTGDRAWSPAQVKTWEKDATVTQTAKVDADCPKHNGSVTFDIDMGPCTPTLVQVFMNTTSTVSGGDSLSYWEGMGDTAIWYSGGPTDLLNGAVVVDSVDFTNYSGGKLTFTKDSLRPADYIFTFVVSDTLEPDSSYMKFTRTFTIGTVDNEPATARIHFDDVGVGRAYNVNTSQVVSPEGTSDTLVTDGGLKYIDLGNIALNNGTCSQDLDFLITHLYDICHAGFNSYYGLGNRITNGFSDITVSVTNIEGNAQGVAMLGQRDSTRNVSVQVGAGAFKFSVDINDGGTKVNKFLFKGNAIDNTAPVVTISGNTLVEIPECSTTATVYFTVDANDGCDGERTPTVTASSGTVSGPTNGMYSIAGVTPGTLTITASATDNKGNSDTETFAITVQQTNTPVAPYIVGAGDIHTVIPVCDADGMIDVGFDLFVIDDCGSATMSSVTSAGVTISQTLGSSSYTAEDLTPGTYAVTATASTGATYSFTITVEAAMADAAPDITLPGNLTFTLPDCDASTEVNLAIHVDDDCADLGTLAGNTVVTLDGATLTPNIDLSGSVNGQAVLTFTVAISSAYNGAELKVTTTDGSQSSTAQANITVLQNAVATDYVCEDNIIIKLDEDDCGATVTPSMVLKGDESTICNNLLQVVVEKFDANGNFDGYEVGHVSGVGTRRYMVYSSALAITPADLSKTSQFFVNRNDMICWGTLTTEDKTQPVIVCPDDAFDARRLSAGYYVLMRVDEDDPSFYPQTFSCYQSTVENGVDTDNLPVFFPYNNPDEAHYYRTYTFAPAQAGKYTITLYAFADDTDFSMALFQQDGPVVNSGITSNDFHKSDANRFVSPGWFDADEACSNIVAFGESIILNNDEGGFGDEIQSTPSWEVADPDSGDEVFEGVVTQRAVQRMSLPVSGDREYTLLVTTRDAGATGFAGIRFERDGADDELENLVFKAQTIKGAPLTEGEINAQVSKVPIIKRWSRSTDDWGNVNSKWEVDPVNGAFFVDRELFCHDLDKVLVKPGNADVRHIASNTNCYKVDAAGVVVSDLTDDLQAKLYYTGYPVITDNCGDVTVCVEDVVTKEGDCTQQYITRTFSVYDDNGNVGQSCTQRINFTVPEIADLALPHYTQYLECNEGFATDSKGNPSPDITGYPFMRSAFGYKDLAPEWCNLAASYSDEAKIPGCEGGYKLRREWTILDWCRPGTSIVYNQLIKVGDFTAPTMSSDVASLAANNRGLKVNGSKITYSTSPFDCTASFAIPYPYPVDNCSAWIDVDVEVQEEVTVSIKDHFGNEVGTRKEWQTIREGRFTSPSSLSVSGIASYRTYQFVYTAVDGCGNKSEPMAIGFEVKDLIEPVSVCDDQITVTLGGGSFDLDNTSATTSSGYARLYKQDLGEGEMWDNCGVADYHVRRKGDTAWGEYVGFTCADVGTPVEVELEVIDINGNKSLCWLNVVVEDKTRPYCVAPVDVTDDCTTIPADFNPPATLAAYTALPAAAKAALHAQLDELFGAAEILDNCNSVTVSQAVTKIDWHCNSGTITRSFSGVDGYGNTTVAGCTQSITITREHDYSFTLPKDESVATCATAYDVFDINPVVTGCDLISVYTTDKQFEASGDECYKLFRTFEVVNWCQFTGNDLSVADPFLIKRDWVDGTGANVGKVANNFVVTYTEVLENNVMTDHILVGKSAGKDDYYNANASVVDATGAGYYQYTQIIAVYDNVAPTVSATVEAEYCAYDCDGASVVVAISVSDDCTPADLNVEAYVWPGGSEAAKFAITATLTQVSSGILPVGAHKLEVVAFDGCGNTNRVVEDLVIADCKAPSPTCISGIAVELMPYDANGDGTIDDGRMAIHASDYVQGEAFDCAGPVKYSIHLSREPQTAGELSLLDQIEQFVVNGDMELGDLLDSDQTSDLVTCDDAGKTLMAVIAAWDANGNGDYCETFLIVQDNMNLCGNGAAGPAVAGLISTETNNTVENVEVNLSGQMTDNMLTTTDGNYVFVNLQSGYDYTITPLLDDDHDNGVTTFDLIEIGKHILTVKPLGSPYKMIAADVDNNRSITTLDLIQLRRLILSVDTEFANNTSWRFVDASYQFPNPSNPWSASFPEIININDLDGSELSGDFVAIKVGDVTLDAKANSLMTSGRSVAGQFNLDVADVAMKAGGEYTVAFNASNLSDIQGYQFTLNLDASVELVDINYGVAVEENFGTRFVSEGAITTSWNGAAESGMLFELVLRAKADVQLSEVVDVTSRYTVAEAYNNNGQLLDVAINFNNGATASSVELYQNTPNPFKGETVVGFNLPEAASATLTITDVTGKVLRVVRGEYARGYNQVNLNSAQLPATGVLYYTLETGDFTATKKMVIVE